MKPEENVQQQQKKKPQGIQENKVVKKNRIERWRKRFTAREIHWNTTVFFL